MSCRHVYRSQAHISAPAHMHDFNRDLAWSSCVGFVAISNTVKKKTQPELLIGLVLICYHHKGKERTLSCAFAINKPSKLRNKTQARTRRKSSWVEIKRGNGERGTDSILFSFPNMLPLFWDHWLLGLWLSEIFVPFKLRILWKESSRPPLTVYAAFIFPSRPSLFQTVYTPIDPYKLYISCKNKSMFNERSERKKREHQKREGEKSPPASCKHAVAREAVQHFQCHSLNNTNYQPKTC